MSTPEQTSGTWRKSSYSSSVDKNCVEVATVLTGSVIVRDSKDATGPELRFTLTEWVAFLQAVRDGEFDLQLALPAPSREHSGSGAAAGCV